MQQKVCPKCGLICEKEQYICPCCFFNFAVKPPPSREYRHRRAKTKARKAKSSKRR